MFASANQLRLLAVLSGVLAAVHASLQIVPGGTWTASNGFHLQAHGAGVIAVNGTYYIIGEDKTGGSAFQNVNCYSSTDLVQWHYVGALLSRTGSGDLGPNRIVERPKVIYNDKTGKYVLWIHADSSNYGDAKVGVATGDSVCGKYRRTEDWSLGTGHWALTHERPLMETQQPTCAASGPWAFQSRDMGLFKDDDGNAYLLTEDRENGVRINKLTADYTDVAGSTYLWKDRIEAPALVKVKGRYYMFGSRLTGWDANDNVYSTSTSLTSGWSPWANFADKGSNTYSSQTTFILDYGGGNVMYMGDRWVSKNLQASTYVWLPLTISGTSVSMKNAVSWVPNVGGVGSWSAPPAEESYEGEKATYSGAAKDVSCSACSGKKAAGYIGGPADNNGKITFSNVQSDKGGMTSIRIKYSVSEAKGRFANVSVNGGPPVKIQFLPVGGDPGSSVLNVQLKSGSNTIVIEGVDGGWGPDVDRLMVPEA